MLSFFRRVSKSKVGTWLTASVLITILAGFAAADLRNVGSGDLGFGMSASTLAEVGSQRVTEDEMSDAMQRRLQQVRQERAEANYASVIGDFDLLLGELFDQKTLIAFADKYGFPLSRRLVDAEIAQIPQTKGLNGQFNEQSYQNFLAQQRLSDSALRELLSGGILQRFMLTPVSANARLSVGMATPYASMLLEQRQGDAAAIPVGAFRAGLQPTDADLQTYYSANRSRYMVPEQRVLRVARIGPDQVAGVTASPQEIASYYNSHKAEYAAKDTRSISQAVAQDQATANAIAARAKGGGSIAAAAAPVAGKAAVTSLSNQSRQAYAAVAGEQAAAAVFAAPAGTVVGPVRTDFGWAVAKVDAVNSEGGKSLEQARAEIATKLSADKRKTALEDLVDNVQNAVDEGSNFSEAAGQAKLTVTTTPLITANGTSRADTAFKFPADLAPALKTGFEIAANDPPEIVTLPNDAGYALVAPGEVLPAAPAPLGAVRQRVADDWVNAKASERAKAVASAVQAKVAKGMPLAQAMKEAGGALPAVRPIDARRIELATAQGNVPPALQMLFTLGQGKSRMFPDPQGRGFFIVKVNKIIPGNAVLQPALIGRMQNDLQQSLSDEYARQFLAAMRQQLKAERNESAIRSLKTRLLTSGS